MLADLAKNELKLYDKDLSEPIALINELLTLNVKLHADISALLENDKSGRFQLLTISRDVLDEVIDTLYAVSRKLKKANHKVPSETSQLAIDSSRKSISTLEKIMYGSGR